MQHAEAVLLVYDDEAESGERNGFLNERVRADGGVNLARAEVFVEPLLFARAQRAGEQFDAVRRLGQHPLDVARVLLGEDFRRRHQRRLIAVLHRREHREQGHGGLAAAHVALQQTIHRHVRLHVVEDARHRASLRGGQREGKHGEHPLMHSFGDFDDGALRLFHPFVAADGNGEGDPEELLEDEAEVGGAARALVLGERRVFGREVDAAQRVRAPDQFLATEQVGGQRLDERFVIERGEDGVHDLAQALRAELAELAIDGHATPDVNRRQRRVGRLLDGGFRAILFFAGAVRTRFRWGGAGLRVAVLGLVARFKIAARFLCFGHANQRVLRRRERARQHLQLVRLGEAEREGVAARVPLPFAEGDETRAAREPLPVIGDDALRLLGRPPGDEPPDDDRLAGAFGVARRHLEDEERRRLRPAILADLKTARHAHIKFERRLDAVSQFADAREVRAILVAHRQVVQQVFDRRLARVAFARDVRHGEREFARRRRPEAGDANLMKCDERRVE